MLNMMPKITLLILFLLSGCTIEVMPSAGLKSIGKQYMKNRTAQTRFMHRMKRQESELFLRLCGGLPGVVSDFHLFKKADIAACGALVHGTVAGLCMLAEKFFINQCKNNIPKITGPVNAPVIENGFSHRSELRQSKPANPFQKVL